MIRPSPVQGLSLLLIGAYVVIARFCHAYLLEGHLGPSEMLPWYQYVLMAVLIIGLLIYFFAKEDPPRLRDHGLSRGKFLKQTIVITGVLVVWEWLAGDANSAASDYGLFPLLIGLVLVSQILVRGWFHMIAMKLVPKRNMTAIIGIAFTSGLLMSLAHPGQDIIGTALLGMVWSGLALYADNILVAWVMDLNRINKDALLGLPLLVFLILIPVYLLLALARQRFRSREETADGQVV